MEQGKVTAKSVLIALIGVLLVGVGVAFNNCAGLGNDPVGIVYDGIRNVTGMGAEQLGLASNIVNLSLALLVFFTGRKYISVGTLVYFLPYGFFVELGILLYQLLAPETGGLAVQIAFSVVGCLLLYLGVAVYITMDIGVDPFTGIVLVIRDAVKKEYRIVKIIFDITMIILGTVLGGKLGAVTIITALTAGPVIQFFSGELHRLLIREPS
ncbi:hypothetical protein B5F29_08630 [Lachnoclostridium sp. An196]|uniref:YczE/YyaS/YitT family protein n=1 Tax=Lachnoclostridium sp. An196 TaxID=1965583 RepID=UPI000B3B039D|nr:hypothetical protein [Lachnoclostridium sp. An196]OUP19390.1 hypothetical protein B5F29_08630 [Lachnoclostridium sp. An196]